MVKHLWKVHLRERVSERVVRIIGPCQRLHSTPSTPRGRVRPSYINQDDPPARPGSREAVLLGLDWRPGRTASEVFRKLSADSVIGSVQAITRQTVYSQSRELGCGRAGRSSLMRVPIRQTGGDNGHELDWWVCVPRSPV